MENHNESELLNSNKRCRDEKPETMVSPEQEQGSRKRRRKKKNKEKVAEEPNQNPPLLCPKPLEITSMLINLAGKGAETPKKKKWKKKKKNVHNPQGEQPQPQPNTKPVPGTPTTPIDNSKSKQQRNKRVMCLDEKGENARNILPLERTLNPDKNQTQPGPPMPTCPIPEPSIGQTNPVDTPISVETAQKTNKKKRKKRNSGVLNGAEEPNQQKMEPPETPTIPKDPPLAMPVGSATPTDTEHKNSKKKRKKKKKSNLQSEGEKPNEQNGMPPETPVQKSAAPSIDPATPNDSEQKMTKKKKKKKKRNSALKSEGNQHNTDRIADTPFQRNKGLSDIKAPFELLTEGSKICQACRKPGHKFQQCSRLRCLSKDEEICFFCGEIGHSLGKCSVSTAGGGRFARCLFCFGYGHFSNNCPENGH